LVDSGQSVFDFEAKVLEWSAGAASQLPSAETVDAGPDDADAWFQLGCDLEGSKPAQAREAYRRALDIDSSHPDAHINLGRLLHESGELAEAENHYRCAINSRPNDVTAAFNLGVVLDDQEKLHQAVIAYRQAIACDPTCADAHFNLAQLYERLGRRADAIRHLKACRGLAIKT
jgi:tetratricopeptide (TPR) repeat protein